MATDLLGGQKPSYNGAGDVEMGSSGGTSDELAPFFNEVSAIKSGMAGVRRSLHKLQDANEESKTITKAADMKDLRERMDADVDDVRQMVGDIKNRLEALDKQNAAYRAQPGAEGDSQDRTRTSITLSLRKKLKELSDEFQDLRQAIQDDYKEVVERRYFTVTGKKADEDTLDQLIETGESEQIFKRAILDQGRGQVLDTVAEIQERHDAIKDLEQRLLELHQIFLDMAVLVETQGEMLDNIESQVGKAQEHVEKATTELAKAKTLQKKYRKWVCIGLIVLLLIIAVIVLIVIHPWKP